MAKKKRKKRGVKKGQNTWWDKQPRTILGHFGSKNPKKQVKSITKQIKELKKLKRRYSGLL